MIVFKTFLKILKSCKVPIILYTVILISFSIFNTKTNETTNFIASKPNIFIVNEAEEVGITKHYIDYLKENTNILSLKEEELEDALFYRDISLIIYISKDFRENILSGKQPEIEIKSTQDYKASLAQRILERYLKVIRIYQNSFTNEEEILKKATDTLSKSVEIETISKIDTDSLSKMSSYYNFASYSILAGSVYVICLIISAFKEKNIQKRTMVSSMNYKKYNRQLLFSNSIFATILCCFYILLGFILIGREAFSIYGILFILNFFIFTICALTLSFFIGNLIKDKNALNGIVNVVALGSSFLCGVFVPMEWLPEKVLTLAHVLPSYYYVMNNNMIIKLSSFHFEEMKPIFVNICILLLFSIGFVVITNRISSKKRSVNER